MADSAVTEAKLQSGSVNRFHLNLKEVQASIFPTVVEPGPGGEVEIPIVEGIAAEMGTPHIFFLQVNPSGTYGNGKSSVEASIVYQQKVSTYPVLCIRLVNRGTAEAHVHWKVWAMAPFDYLPIEQER
jgi:hypothetical protein